MTMRILTCLVLLMLFLFVGNSFIMGEDKIIAPQGSEGPTNVFYGNGAGETGSDNTFIGIDAGNENEDGYRNTFLGKNSGKSNTSGYDNTFLGMNAGQANLSGDQNTFVGRAAGYASNVGNKNTFVGYGSGNQNVNGDYNTFIGHGAGWTNTSGTLNSFLGGGAGYYNSVGTSNSFFGWYAGYKNKQGDFNSFFGAEAGYSNQFGKGNVFLGYRAGYNESGSNKLYIQVISDLLNPTPPLIYGEFDNKFLKINGNFTATATSISSDGRFKKDIQPLESSLEKLSELNGVRFQWRTAQYPGRGFRDGEQIGLIAQEVESVFPQLVEADRDGYKAVSYSKLTAVLVEAVKELKSENQNQKKLMKEQRHQFEKQLEEQQAEIENLRLMIEKLKG